MVGGRWSVVGGRWSVVGGRSGRITKRAGIGQLRSMSNRNLMTMHREPADSVRHDRFDQRRGDRHEAA
ncbi:hypothetical protein DF040_14230 [Burkholderia cenocepacia]|nr:hypothetical protein DF040_14230 [Burkholderia cenocepacia]